MLSPTHVVVELQQEIDKDSARYIRHSLRASSSVPPSPTSRAPSPKSSLIPDKITSSYEELRELANEKRDLAQRLIDLITRTRVRLDSDLNKVRVLQGDVGVEYVPSGGLKPISAAPLSSFDSMTTAGRNPAQAISESLRNALATPLVEVRQSPGTPSTTASASVSSATKSECSIPGVYTLALTTFSRAPYNDHNVGQGFSGCFSHKAQVCFADDDGELLPRDFTPTVEAFSPNTSTGCRRCRHGCGG